MLSIKGFGRHRNGKSHPVHEKKGVDEKSFSVTEKGMNDKIEVKIDPVKTNKKEDKLTIDDVEKRPSKTMNLGGNVIEIPFDEKAWKYSVNKAEIDKNWAERTQHDKNWLDNASEMSKKMLSDYLIKSTYELANEYYQYWYTRSHSNINNSDFGGPSPIDPEWFRKWEEITGKPITENDFITN